AGTPGHPGGGGARGGERDRGRAAAVAGGGRPPRQVDSGQPNDRQRQVGGGATQAFQAEHDRDPQQHIDPERTRDRQGAGEDLAQDQRRKQRGGQQHGRGQRLAARG